MPDPSTPVRVATGYKGGDDASGAGGRARSQIMSDQVDAIAGTGGSAHPAAQAASSTPASTPKPHPASYAPSGDTGPRVYGSPIEGNGPSK